MSLPEGAGKVGEDLAPAASGRWPQWLVWLRAWAPYALGALMFLLALLVLHRTLAEFSYQDLRAELARLTPGRLGLATLWTALSFAALVGYELFGLRFAGRRLPLRTAALASFVSQSIAHSTGFALLVATSLRYRVYAASGFDLVTVAKVQAFFTLTFGLGMATLAAAVLVAEPDLLAGAIPLGAWAWRAVGLLLLAGVVGYLIWGARFHRPLRWGARSLEPPRAGTTGIQIGLGIADLGAAAAALYVLLPGDFGLGYGAVLGVFVAAVVVGVVSHVPGGLGVFESTVILLVRPSPEQAVPLIGALLAFRLVYYVLPLVAGVGMLGVLELQRWRAVAGAVTREALSVLGPVVPWAAAALALAAGVVLLVSGATPAQGQRLEWLAGAVPLHAVEVSHFLGSVVGVLLVALAKGLTDRIQGAWTLTVGLLGLGVVLSLLKGWDYEEAIGLGLTLLVLLPYRGEFYRRCSPWSDRLTAGWLAALGVVAVVVWWLVLFAFRHVDYSHELWWQFELQADAPRTLRAALGVSLLALLLAGAHLLRPSRFPFKPPDHESLARARRVVEASPSADAHLALTGDKALLFDPTGEAFVMYGVAGRSLVAMGGPVGPEERWPGLVWEFHALADRYGRRTVFYEVGPEHLPLLLDLGLLPAKLGERARVLLPDFSLEGKRRADLRHAQRRATREGARFELLPPAALAPVLDEIEAVSTLWLREHQAREKRFSLGYFERAYLQTCSVGVVRRSGRVVAFANLWSSAGRAEVSVDLMRFGPDAPYGTMDFLFAELMLWAKAEGYRWFGLGMAPLSGLPDHRLAPLWSRLGRFMFRHGAHFYNFQGLRAYKDKFGPVWTPVYLVCPPRALPRVLPEVTALIAGGWGAMLRR